MPVPSIRLNHIPNSAISLMGRLAEQYQAVNLAQGVPDFDPPAEMLAAAGQALLSGHNQYTATWGSPRLRKALADKHNRFSGLEIDPEQHVTITVGDTEAILAALITITNPGDPVVIFSPHYEAYLVDARLLNARPVHVPLHPPELTFDPDDLRKAFQAGARALVLCNPANPTGKVFTLEELQTIASLAQEYDVTVIADEIYEHIVYAPHQHTYIASLPGMFDRTISCSSLSKTYAATGWRVGWAIAPPAISDGLRKVHDFLSVCAPSPLQEGAVTALEFPATYYERMLAEYERKRDLFIDLLSKANLRFIQPQGAYFVLVDISDFGFEDDFDFCTWMVKEIGLASMPGSYFFHEPIKSYIRLNFAKRDETLFAAGERLMRLAERR
ncbi:MAG: pyridoxal phosphate-dependent aminotransferase [Anaerolineales bacterium]|nr:pyridoxal phosphate-dependent aminotransferase [Anaerolineales bacterium]